jgi:hypothetical protein
VVPGLRRALAHIASIDRQIAWCDARIAEHVRKDKNVKLAMSICGVGAFTASALAADVGDLTPVQERPPVQRLARARLGNTPRAATHSLLAFSAMAGSNKIPQKPCWELLYSAALHHGLLFKTLSSTS